MSHAFDLECEFCFQTFCDCHLEDDGDLFHGEHIFCSVDCRDEYIKSEEELQNDVEEKEGDRT